MRPENLLMDGYKGGRVLLMFIWVPIKVAIASYLIYSFEFGIYIVAGYLIYSLEKVAGLQFINSQETNIQLSKLQQSEQNKEVGLPIDGSLEDRISILEEQVFELQLQADD
jgi:hypothetical protein